MKLIKESNLSILFRVFGWRGRDRLAVAVLHGFSLDRDKTPVEEADLWGRISQALGPDQVLDLAMPKTGGEILVLGKCFAPAGTEVQGGEAFFRVGPLEKRVHVFGDRYYEPGLVGHKRIPPAPFTQMDISWENAFGGPENDRNPAGKGLVPIVGADGVERVPLPNIENPNQLIASPKDQPDPAGFGPLGFTWPPRIKNFGTFDDQWFHQQWPGLPDDFNFDYFSLAPEDQRIKSYFTGDETILIQGMHPETPEIVSALPNQRCRLFVHQESGTDNGFRELAVQLDTVYLVPHLDVGLVIWHGSIAVADDEAEDVRHIVAFREPMDEPPQPEAFYFAKLEEPAVEIDSLEPALPEEPPQEAATPEIEEMIPVPPQDNELQELLGDLEERINDRQAELDAYLLEHGADPAIIKVPEPLVASLVIEDVSVENLLAQNEAAIADTEGQLKAHLAAAGLDPDVILGPDAPPMEPPENPFAIKASTAEEFVDFYKNQGVEDPELLGQLRRLYLDTEAARAGEAQAHAEFAALSGEQPALEGGAALSPEVTGAADTAPDTIAAGVGLPETETSIGTGTALTREIVISGHARGKSFANADLTGLDLSDCDLSGIDLKGATLDGVNFSNTNLANATLSQAMLSGVELTGADLTKADLSSVSAPAAKLSETNLAGANLSDADFTEADFSQANLEQADLTGAVFSRSLLTGAKCKNLRAGQAIFESADCTGTDFRESDLSQADLSGIKADHAMFSKANARNARFYGAQGEGTDFEGANLSRSRAGRETSFSNGRFVGADLSHACWEDSDLSSADLSGSDLRKAQMNKCRFHNAAMTNADAREADLSKSDFSEADMKSVNLMNGSLRKAIIVQADLSGANLYRVDFFKSKHGQTVLAGANLDGTLLNRF